jgi:hydroxyethylthiazole kinase-like uncharacterized protein yjeF
LRTAALRRAEAAAAEAKPPLMERAGLAAAALARRLLGDHGRRVLVLAGPGNNGGDAFEAAWHLRNGFFRVTLVFAGDSLKLPADAAGAHTKWLRSGGGIVTDLSPKIAAAEWDLVIDGLFGVGLARPLAGRHAAWVEAMNGIAARNRIPLLALDVPSGIAGDSGAVLGVAVRATHTLTFIAHKPGLFTLDGPDHCGELACTALGLAPDALEPDGELLSAAVLDALSPRPRNFHKGLAGNVIVVGGATGMAGAAIIAGRAALNSGAGKVFVAPPAGSPMPPLDGAQPELMFRSASQALAEPGVVLAGPGMGQAAASRALLRGLLAADHPLVLDADALNLIGAHKPLQALTRDRTAPTLMTPHPAEAARLLGVKTTAVQSDRVAAACEIAARYRSVVVLKGNGSVIARPRPDAARKSRRGAPPDLHGAGSPLWWINPTGNPGMASAGMGDALGGLAASFLAQGLAPLAALQLAVWLHGAAADELCAAGRGPLGTTASDVIEQARLILNRRRPE